jgi:hypothetical protein
VKRGSVVEMPETSSDMEDGEGDSGTSSTFSVAELIF